MSKEPPAFLIPASTIFVIAAVASAAAGGLMQDDGLRLLFGAGVALCLSILGALLMWVHDLPRETLGGLHAALGALMGLCAGFFFAKEPVLLSLIGYVVGGTILGFIGYWTRVWRSSSYWRE